MLNENINDFDIEELEDFEANEEVTYFVCALGYNEYDEITDCAVSLGEFKLPGEAILFAKTVTLEAILQEAAKQGIIDISEVAYFNLEIETVVECEDSEDGTENIDTIWELKFEV